MLCPRGYGGVPLEMGTLPLSMLMGTDVPVLLLSLVANKLGDCVMTRELKIEKKPLTDATKRSLEYVQIRC